MYGRCIARRTVNRKKDTMIQLKITGVSRRASSQVGTRRYTYNADKPRTAQQFHGAEWEEVEFQLVEEAEPPIGVANIDGSAYLVGNVAKILLNDPALFGAFKIGDVINFIPVTEDIQTTGEPVTEPAPPPQPVIETTAEETIVVPNLF
jgi:hypothetical protein